MDETLDRMLAAITALNCTVGLYSAGDVEVRAVEGVYTRQPATGWSAPRSVEGRRRVEAQAVTFTGFVTARPAVGFFLVAPDGARLFAAPFRQPRSLEAVEDMLDVTPLLEVGVL